MIELHWMELRFVPRVVLHVKQRLEQKHLIVLKSAREF